MNQNNKIVTVFGGTGFVGRQVVQELAKLGLRVKVATRCPESAYFLKLHGTVGQVVPIACDYSKESIALAVVGSDYVVNCIGVLNSTRRARFKDIHVALPKNIAKACMDSSVKRFVHISALGVKGALSAYGKTKLEGEQAALVQFPDMTVLRPSVIFGMNDRFFNLFSELSRYTKILPLFGGGRTKFQPVYVGDVAAAVIASLYLGGSKNDNPQGKTYELGGPDVISLRGAYESVFHYTDRARMLVPAPWFIGNIMALFFGLLPNPLITRDQLKSLRGDNVVSDGARTLQDLGVKARSMDLILPQYLKDYRSGGRFAQEKHA